MGASQQAPKRPGKWIPASTGMMCGGKKRPRARGDDVETKGGHKTKTPEPLPARAPA